ncbi:heterotrimeric G-protein alpha subunit, GPA2-like protein [Mycena olivaceomarginata]|nr:heterotrimeric G-protein alpha subunit, GPA2-like protein [Mycena olivaceomarginata]
MGGCISSPAPPGAEVSDRDRQLHRQAEKALKDAKAKMAVQVKVLLLGSGDSGKSTILKQMRLIHRVPFSSQETESFRQLVFDNLTRGLKYLLDALPDMELELPPAYADVDDAGWRSKKGGDNGEDDEGVTGVRGEGIADDVALIEGAEDLRDGEPFPMRVLWGASRSGCLPFAVRSCVALGVTDIVRARARTIGITETTFNLRDHEMLMVDDVTSILFLVSLSGYDQCLVEDRDANQMQDAMTIWDSICHSQWFKQTSIILFLNKNDLFEKKIKTSDIKSFFPRRDYFKRRFGRLAQKAGRAKEREIYIHITTATDTELLRVIMAAVEGAIVLRSNLVGAALI